MVENQPYRFVMSHPPRPLHIFGTLWSLRQYPTKTREWSWAKKFSAIADAGCDGLFSAPIPELEARGSLQYLAVASFGQPQPVEAQLRAARQLGAVAIGIQLGDTDSALADMIKLAIHIDAVARDFDLPYAIETHRDTFTETPENTLALTRGFSRQRKTTLPLCLDHSHFAVVRHHAPGTYWERLRQPVELLNAATQFHLRPFNGHHCQIPVLTPNGRRTPEYRDWLTYLNGLFTHLHTQNNPAPVLAVPELGNAAPAYGLSCFGDTWRDAQALIRDLRRTWKSTRPNH